MHLPSAANDDDDEISFTPFLATNLSRSDEYKSENNADVPLSKALSPHIFVTSISLPTNYKTIS